MTEGFDSIVAQLEHQKTAIEQALAALREVEGVVAPAATASSSSAPAKRRGPTEGLGAKPAFRRTEETMGGEKGGGCASRSFKEGRAAEASIYAGGLAEACRGNEKTLGGQKGRGQEGRTQARHEKSGIIPSRKSNRVYSLT